MTVLARDDPVPVLGTGPLLLVAVDVPTTLRTRTVAGTFIGVVGSAPAFVASLVL